MKPEKPKHHHERLEVNMVLPRYVAESIARQANQRYVFSVIKYKERRRDDLIAVDECWVAMYAEQETA